MAVYRRERAAINLFPQDMKKNFHYNKTDLRRANCSQTTSERFASSVAGDTLVRLVLV